MKPALSSILLTLLAAVALSAALFANPAQQTFIGVITDSMCPKGDHSQMQMGSTDADCTAACISVHGAEYVLYDGKAVYTLSDQKTPGKFAGKKVKVLGTLDAKSKKIQVDSITAEK
jgi:hypothetical protein